MSTFNGVVLEFPFIRIDYFRKNPDQPAPLAGFLSHVHSDHLQGLESWRAPFIYCSSATKQILLRLEKYPHRMNFSKGILESRKQHYKHLAKILRPIPLNTPTEIELTPRRRIRVTLLDANHCVGAVMFLVEGAQKSILYTGDIRAEGWWVSQLARNPILLPYTSNLRHLDKVYLDTTFAIGSRLYASFPPKAEGIKELLKMIAVYPEDTIFYFRAWTFGYEDVWQALAAALHTTIHLDRYQMRLYQALLTCASTTDIGSGHDFLYGYRLGNKLVPGCLSENETDSRIHSCEPGVLCPTVASGKVVYITPIVNRLSDGLEVLELGAGGGRGDLYQTHELELPDKSTVEELEKLFAERISDSAALFQTRKSISEAFASKKSLSLGEYGLGAESKFSLNEVIEALKHGRQQSDLLWLSANQTGAEGDSRTALPRVIHFPYSRHSSYTELCELVSLFKPRDIHPCTVNIHKWDESLSMQRLFGHLCSSKEFAHDKIMRDLRNQVENEQGDRYAPDQRRQSTSPPPSQPAQTTSSTTSSINRLNVIFPSSSSSSSSLLGTKIGVTVGDETVSRAEYDDFPQLDHNDYDPSTETIQPDHHKIDSLLYPPSSSSSSSSSSPPQMQSRHPRHLDPQREDKKKENEEEAQRMHDLNIRICSLRDHLIEIQDQANFTIAPLPSFMERDRLHHHHGQHDGHDDQQNQNQNLNSLVKSAGYKNDTTAFHNHDPLSHHYSPPPTTVSASTSFRSGADPLVPPSTAIHTTDGMGDTEPESSSSKIVGSLPDYDRNNYDDYGEDEDEEEKENCSQPTHDAISLQIPNHIQKQNRKRKRKRRLIAAYQAAKAGTYDAWSEFAPVSADNGHTAPEIEL